MNTNMEVTLQSELCSARVRKEIITLEKLPLPRPAVRSYTAYRKRALKMPITRFARYLLEK